MYLLLPVQDAPRILPVPFIKDQRSSGEAKPRRGVTSVVSYADFELRRLQSRIAPSRGLLREPTAGENRERRVLSPALDLAAFGKGRAVDLVLHRRAKFVL
jgi:hypothetical protein